MSDYTKLTDFASKDALPSGNAAKIVKGTEIDDEFEAIETAVATKADLDAPTFTGVPAAPTASFGTDSTQIATTAFVQDALAALHPVGSIYINATSSTNPGTLLGFGTWTAFGAGKVMVGLDSTDTDFDTAEETGGAKTHTLTTDEMPAHTHSHTDDRTFQLGTAASGSGVATNTSNVAQSRTTGSTGGGNAHNNLQPYVVVDMWKRTA